MSVFGGDSLTHLAGMVGGTVRMTFVLFFIEVGRQLALYGPTHALRPSADGTRPGLLEYPRNTVPIDFGGILPDVLGSLAGIVAGLSVFFFGAFLVILTQFLTTLYLGVDIPHMQSLYDMAGLAIIATVAFQYEVMSQTRASSWYRGY